MVLNLQVFVDNDDQMMGRTRRKMTDIPMEINKIVLDILNKFVDFYLFVVCHERGE